METSTGKEKYSRPEEHFSREIPSVSTGIDFTPEMKNLQFIDRLHRGGNYSYWWVLPGRRSYWWPCGKFSPIPKNANIYFGVHPVKEIPARNAAGKPAKPGAVRSQTEYIQVVNCLFCEFDAKQERYGSKEAILQHIEQLAELPAVVIDSGGGYHAYWLFSESYTIREGHEREDLGLIADMQSEWVRIMGGDPDAKDLARVLRVPGTTNYKYIPARPVEFIRYELEREITILQAEGIIDRANRAAYMGGSETQARSLQNEQAERARNALDNLALWRCDDYAAWVAVGMALSELGEYGFTLWDNWSRKSQKYQEGVCAQKWKTFQSGDGVGLGSLYHWAREDSGWVPGAEIAYNEPLFIDDSMLYQGGGYQVPARNDSDVSSVSYSELLSFDDLSIFPGELSEPDEDEDEDGVSFPLSAWVPELPAVARLPGNLLNGLEGAGRWLTDYIDFAKQASPMTPDVFHEALGLTLLSTAIARRVYLRVGNQYLYPNLYMLMVAHSTLYAKTTALETARRVLELANLEHLTLPVGITTQSLVSELTQTKGGTFNNWIEDDKKDWEKEREFSAQRAWLMDEAAGLLDSFDQKITEGLLTYVLKLFDCPNKLTAQTISRGRETIRYAYLTICGPTTPAAMRVHLANQSRWGNGLFARFLFVTPNSKPVRSFYPAPLEIPESISGPLNSLALEHLPIPPKYGDRQSAPDAKGIRLVEGVWDRWNKYHAGLFELMEKNEVPEKLYSNYGRFHTAAMKIAMQLAAIDWSMSGGKGEITVSMAHWCRAQLITEGYRASLHRMIEDAGRSGNDDETERRIIQRVQQSMPGGMTTREISIALHMQSIAKRAELELILVRMNKDGLIKEGFRVSSRGKKTGVWKISR